MNQYLANVFSAIPGQQHARSMPHDRAEQSFEPSMILESKRALIVSRSDFLLKEASSASFRGKTILKEGRGEKSRILDLVESCMSVTIPPFICHN
jgi:hypothetical protein